MDRSLTVTSIVLKATIHSSLTCALVFSTVLRILVLLMITIYSYRNNLYTVHVPNNLKDQIGSPSQATCIIEDDVYPMPFTHT